MPQWLCIGAIVLGGAVVMVMGARKS